MLGLVAIGIYQQRSARDALVDNVSGQARLMALYSEAALTFSNRSDVIDVLNKGQLPSLQQAAVYMADGEMFATIQRDVLGNLHRDYDIKGSWPRQIGDETGGALTDSALRLLVLRGLTALFQLQSADPFVFRYTIASVEPQDDGTVAVLVSIDLATTHGHRPLKFTPSLVNQRFVLAGEGWWPALYVKAHPAFSVAY